MSELPWKGCEQGKIHYPKKCTNQKVSGYEFPIKHFLSLCLFLRTSHWFLYTLSLSFFLVSIASSLSLHMWSQSLFLVPFCSPRIFVCVYTHTHSVSTITSSYVLQSKRNHTFIPKSLTHTPHLERARCWLMLTPPPSPFAHPATAKEHWQSGGGMWQRGPRCGPLDAREKNIYSKSILVKRITCEPFCSIKSRTRVRGGEQPPRVMEVGLALRIPKFQKEASCGK